MSNPEKLIQALSHMSMLSIEGYTELCYLFLPEEISNILINNYKNNFKHIHNSNSSYTKPEEEVFDNLFNHNNLSEEAICYIIGFIEDQEIFKKYCPHISASLEDPFSHY